MKTPGEMCSGKHEIIILHLHNQTLSGVSAVDITKAGWELARTQVFMEELSSNLAAMQAGKIQEWSALYVLY